MLLLPLLVISNGCTGGPFVSAREDLSTRKNNTSTPKQIVITENTIYQNNRSGLRIRGDLPVTISQCDVYQNGRAGVNVEHSAEVTIESSKIFNNENSGISANNASNLLIKNSMVYQNHQGGIRVRQNKRFRQKSSIATLQQNKIFYNGQGGVHAVANSPYPIQLTVSGNSIYRNNKAGIRIQDNLRLTAKNNAIYRNGAAGIASYVSADLPPKLDIYQNKIYFNLGAGIFVGSGITGSVGFSNNMIYNNYRAGIALGLMNQPGDELVDVEIFHNTIVANGSNEEGAGIRNDSRGDVKIKNNIIAYNFTTGIMTRGCGGTSYNLLFANGETSNVKTDSNDQTFLTEKVQYSGCSGRQWGDVLSAPLFLNPDGYDFSLQENSPARNAADTIDSPYFLAFPNNNFGAAPFPSAAGQIPGQP